MSQWRPKNATTTFFFENLDNFQILTFLVIFWIIGSKTSSIDLPKIRGMGIDQNLMSNRSNTYSIKSPKWNEKVLFSKSHVKKSSKKKVCTKCAHCVTFFGGLNQKDRWSETSCPTLSFPKNSKKTRFFSFRPWRKILVIVHA